VAKAPRRRDTLRSSTEYLKSLSLSLSLSLFFSSPCRLAPALFLSPSSVPCSERSAEKRQARTRSFRFKDGRPARSAVRLGKFRPGRTTWVRGYSDLFAPASRLRPSILIEGACRPSRLVPISFRRILLLARSREQSATAFLLLECSRLAFPLYFYHCRHPSASLFTLRALFLFATRIRDSRLARLELILKVL
jgi:hypothetical protein